MAEKNRKPSNMLLTLAVMTVIAITLFFLLGPYVPTYLLAAILPIVILLGYIRIFYRYFSDRRGYQDRYQNTGSEYNSQQQIIRFLGLGLVTIMFYAVVNAGLQLLGYDNPTVVFAVTMVLMVIGVRLIDRYSGKLMEEYVDYKSKRHTQFVDSLGNADGICMSCRRKMDPGERFCPHCGFEQRDPEPDTSYTGA